MSVLEDFKADIEDFKKDIDPVESERILSMLQGEGSVKIIELITTLDKKSAATVELLFQQNIKIINTELQYRSRNEKIEYINQKRNAIFSSMAEDHNRGFHIVLDMEIREIPDLMTTVLNFLPSIKEQIPDEISIIGDQDFVSRTVTLFTNKDGLTEEKVEGLFNGILQITANFPALEKYTSAKRPLRTAILTLIFIHYDKHVLGHLNTLLDALENPPVEVLDNSDAQANKEFTLARQNMAIHYLLKHSGLTNNHDKTNIVRLIQFLTGREVNKEAKDTRIYKFVASPFRSDKNLKPDLQFVRSFFENLNLDRIVIDINQEIKNHE